MQYVLQVEFQGGRWLSLGPMLDPKVATGDSPDVGNNSDMGEGIVMIFLSVSCKVLRGSW